MISKRKINSEENKNTNKKPISYWTFLVVLLAMTFFSQFSEDPIQISGNFVRDLVGILGASFIFWVIYRSIRYWYIKFNSKNKSNKTI